MAANPFIHDLSTLDPGARMALDRKPACYIDGQWVAATHSRPVIDPSSGKQVSEIAAGSAEDVDATVHAARRALKSPEWSKMTPPARERLVRRLVALIEEHAQILSQVETVDNGMPAWFSFGGIMAAASIYAYYAGWPSKLSGESMVVEGPPGSGEFMGMTRREPVGVIAAIVPWNVPFMMATWKVAPALAAGCTVVLKPAEDTSLSALILADLIDKAGFPRGVFNIVTGRGSVVGEALINHSGIDKISFTGSTATGRRIGEIAGRNLKKHTLELGGKSPVLLFDDADLDIAVPGAATSIFLNSGQICVAGSRLYVQDGVYDQVVETLHAHAKGLKIGAGLTPDIFLGPVVNAAQQKQINGYVEGAAADGCEVLPGASVKGTEGFFVSPTIVTGAGPDTTITREEVFGPVLSVYRFHDEEEVLALANDSTYGLSSGIWSTNLSRVMRVSAALEAGKVVVNNAGFPYPGLPEGGTKASGHGRDLGREGIEACLQTKTILIGL